ncbi:MAG: class I adenylate-forming enzyme family protein [Acidimicrobiia bacterium]
MITGVLAATDPHRLLLVCREDDAFASLSYGTVRDLVDDLVTAHPELRGGGVALRATAERTTVLWLLALDVLAARVHIVPPTMPDETVEALVADLGLDAVIDGGAVRPTETHHRSGDRSGGRPGGRSEVVLFTSGTTGVPKGVLHTWESLAGRIHRSGALGAARWLLAYPLSAFAGLQVFLHALLNGGSVVLGGGEPAGAAQALRAGVTHVSSTPTFLRLLLMRDEIDAFAPEQFTLGGEPVDQPLLDRVKERFPASRVTHIYASSEMGACFSVHDGRAGFPAELLESDDAPVWLTIVDGELHIRSPYAMGGYVGLDDPRDRTGLYATGDLVEHVGDRVHFLGRRNESINVGGQKVHPREVEEILLAEPRVRAVRVSGASSSVAGQIVRADVVAVPGADAAELRRALLDECRRRLQPYKVPRILRIVDEIEQTDSGKLVRR